VGESGLNSPGQLYVRLEPPDPIVKPEVRDKIAARCLARKIFQTGSGSTSLRIAFPLDHPLTEPSNFISWLLELSVVRSGRFVSGLAGYSLSADMNYQPNAWLSNVLGNHPGFDWKWMFDEEIMMMLDCATRSLTPKFKRVNWLNFLSERIVERLGGWGRNELLSLFEADLLTSVHVPTESKCGNGVRLAN